MCKKTSSWISNQTRRARQSPAGLAYGASLVALPKSRPEFRIAPGRVFLELHQATTRRIAIAKPTRMELNCLIGQNARPCNYRASHTQVRYPAVRRCRAGLTARLGSLAGRGIDARPTPDEFEGVHMLANYIDEIIMFCVGAWATATGFGYLQAPVKDPIARQQWQARFGKILKWIGPILLVIAIALVVSRNTGAAGSP